MDLGIAAQNPQGLPPPAVLPLPCPASGCVARFPLRTRSMAQLAPPGPPSPLVALGDDDRLKRVKFRLWQLLMTALTVLVTGWFITLGPVSAVLALLVAMHVLVAI